jgi:hypothetical protein
LDCRYVCKTCAFHDGLQAGNEKEVHSPYFPDLAPAGTRSGDTVDFTPLDFFLCGVLRTKCFRNHFQILQI